MRWGKFKRIFLKNPYIMSRFQAERIFRAGFPTFEEMIEGAKDRFGLPVEAWADFNMVIAERGRREEVSTKFLRVKQALKEYISSHRKLVISCLIVILTISFFTLIPVGRSLAKEFFDMIIRVVDDRVIVENRNPDYQDVEYGDTVIIEQEDDTDTDMQPIAKAFSNMDEFIEEVGFQPIVIQGGWCEYSSIELLSNSDLGQSLTTKYVDENGLQLTVIQRWNSNTDISFVSEGVGFEERPILNDIVMYCTIDQYDHTFSGVALLDGSILMVGAEDGADIELLLDSLGEYSK